MKNGLYTFTATLPAGEYEYKIAVGGNWDENYGAWGKPNGANIPFSLDQKTKVTFYYHDETHSVTDSTRYTALIGGETPRLVGDLQPEIGQGGEWLPNESQALLHDDNFDNVYAYRVMVPKGHHEFKIVLGDTWEDPAYPGTNAVLNVTKETEITFFYNAETNKVWTDYKGNTIHKDELYHNTWKDLYRKPFGAVAAGESVTLRLRTEKDDITNARLVLKNYKTGTSNTYKMDFSGWTELENGTKADFWKAEVIPEEKGVYGYKFIVNDGPVKAAYGEDTTDGESGKAIDNGAQMFQLTVYEAEYETPDWMKEAVVYQIFPDRFYNGNPNNDDAKQYARGFEPIEHRKWTDLPDNPRLKDIKDYKGDGIWSNDFFGGDVKGVQEKLDYIESLGVNTIYLNPIAHAASNHKYDATDYKAIDPMFGTPKEFKKFTQALKKRDMHLILDGVFNHVGDDSIYFDRYGKYKTVGAYEYWAKIYDLMNNEGLSEEEAKQKTKAYFLADGQVFSEYGFHNWFHIENEKINSGQPNEHYKYQGWWGYDSLPEIAAIPGDVVDYNSELNNEKFADYIMYDKDSVAKTWLKRGASGWRLDVANEVDPEFWREFRDEIKAMKTKTNDSPVILGEIWDDASKYFLGDMYDTVMNYRFRGAVLHYLTTGDAGEAAKQLKAIREDYPKEAYYSLMNLIGSHDTARAVYLLGGGSDTYERAENDPDYNHALGIRRLKLAAIFQMGYPGAPTIYYGDEVGVTGSKDPDNRRTYPWGNVNEDLLQHYRKIGEVRRNFADLFAHGNIAALHAEGDIYAYARYTGDRFAIVAINGGSEEKTVEIDLDGKLINGIKLTDQLDGAYTVESRKGKVSVTIPGMSGRMLVSNDGQTFERPPQVAHLVAEEGSNQVTLSWNGKPGKYNVYQSTVQGGLYEKVAHTSDQTITINGLDNGRKYYFAVTLVDGKNNESEKMKTEAIIPHVTLTDRNYEISNVTDLRDGFVDLSKHREVSADIWIDGVTEIGQAEGLTVKLQVKFGGEWQSYDAAYTASEGDGNTFSSKFLPVNAGTYTYRFAFSTDLGRNWVYSNEQTITYRQSNDDTAAPASSLELKQPIQESGQVNLDWKLVEPDNPYMYAVIRNGKIIKKIWKPDKTVYTDFNVENGMTYEYIIRAYDQYGNATTSNTVTVTPDVVMVEVTFKVHAPSYTSLDSSIMIPNSLNGWNTGAWEMSRNGAVTPDWEYTVKVQEGTKITYKYARDGSWANEGLADHTRNDPADDDISYYGFGAVGTDLEVVVQNEGSNKMVVEDTIYRWIDKPLIITSPKDGTTVKSDVVTVEGNAIKEGILTINGERIPINDDMTFSHEVEVVEGRNEIKFHIEPSQENKQAIFNNNSGAIEKATQDKTLVIYR
ncbi:alpha amylase N-terminal ig-like domain-containing protein [Virgibacillus siamensis]|uniref:alpha amylase N-terminal ig-like domain-containing protein n=1 Tax=Virgibacillus siamensis TaxID=480071 RepID=UPI0009879678|nr:alpha amylase N-terminal ig-like domain-containing protein [Virgibacillus siamensis]